MSVVIVGAGQAGFQTAFSLRTEGYSGRITLIGEETHLPYQRPPLSKGFLLGKQAIESATLRPESFYTAQRIELISGDPAIGIDRASHGVNLASGARVDYEKLVLATGARPRRLPGLSALYLRTQEDAVELKQRLDNAASVAVIGGGFIGLEVAAAASALGKKVTVFEMQDRLMPRCVSPIVSEFFRVVHTANGVEIVLGARAVAPQADLVVAGIGVLPNFELARDTGLPIGNGIVVDQHLRTGDENIFAIGDCAEHPNPFAGARTRLESVQNAVDQAKVAAANIAGHEGSYRATPWFWTDQFDIKLQMAGLSGGADLEAVRGEPEAHKFSVFYFKNARLIAVDSINRPGEHLAARKLLAAGAFLTPGQAADVSFDLKSLNSNA
jgi:3-phenylpropionate/trans-cinnamate dioxygenase ferredoxin reductase component